MPDEAAEAARVAAVAAGSGALARVALALHGGTRKLGLLAIEGVVGASLGIMAAGAFAYWHPERVPDDAALIAIAGAAGMAGALGTRLLDAVMTWLQARAKSGR